MSLDHRYREVKEVGSDDITLFRLVSMSQRRRTEVGAIEPLGNVPSVDEIAAQIIQHVRWRIAS